VSVLLDRRSRQASVSVFVAWTFRRRRGRDIFEKE
jgi:hypothetical protein